MKKRILAFAMSMLLLVSTVLTLASCGGKGDKDDDKQKYDGIQWLDNLGDHDLDGYVVKFAVSEAAEDTYGFNERSIVADESTGDKVDAKIHLRNEAIKARFNCGIELTYKTNNNLTADLNSQFMGKSDEYDVIVGRQYDDVALCLNGYLVNLTKDETASKYLDLTREYWGTNYIKGMSYKNKVYWATGDLNLRYSGGFYGVFVNATLYDTKLKDEYGDIHDVVRNYKWTVKTMKDMSDKVAKIAAANAKPADITESDIVGVAAPIHDNTNGWAVSCGVKWSRVSKSGNLVLEFDRNNTELEDFYNQYLALVKSDGCVDYTATDTFGGYRAAFEVLKADRALFVPGRVNQAELYLRDMQNDFYIIPNPMRNEQQKAYYSSVHDAISIFGINKYSSNVKAAAIVLEAMAAETYRSVRTEYYDNALKNKYTSSPDTAEMIEIISDGAYSDFVLVWCLTPYFSGAGAVLRGHLKQQKESLYDFLLLNAGGWKNNITEELDVKFAALTAAENAA